MTSALEYTHRLTNLLRRERDSMAEFLAELAEFDRLGLWTELGYRNLFDYLHRELGLSAGAAHYRKVAAELVRRYPEVLDCLRDGRICITSVVALSKVLTPENRHEVLPRFFNRSKREAQELAAELRPAEVVPQREVVTAFRPSAPPVRVAAPPAPMTAAVSAPTLDLPKDVVQPVEKSVTDGCCSRPDPAREPPAVTIEPLTADLSRLHITVPKRLLSKLDRARDALSNARPGASIADILEAGLDLVLDRAAKRRGLVAKPQAKLRPAKPDRVRASVVREVWKRDGGRCQFRLPNGEICGSTVGLELHHREARARGGGHTAEDLVLHCKPHHRFVTRQDFGDEWIDACVRRRRESSRRARARPGCPGGTNAGCGG
jgi:hypothetical protein